MTKEEFTQLAKKISDGTASDAEIELYNNWYNSFNKNLNWNEQELGPRDIKEASLYKGIQAAINQSNTIKLWPRIAGIGAAVAAIILGVWFYNIRHLDDRKDLLNIAKNDIAPGKNGATLTLANGKKIRLSDAVAGQIATEAGISVTKTADGQLNYQILNQMAEGGKSAINVLSTSAGETYMVTLPDKSKVWLNAASSLTYSASLNERGLRRVRLEGEAYFEVAKDKRHPFVVESRGQQVKVLGTHFNVNAYADEPAIKTTLLEGAVNVVGAGTNRNIVPGQQVINGVSGLQVVAVNTENAVDWKQGEFNLNEVDFRVAMRKIARWYDVELVYDKSVPDGIEAWGWISRNSKLSSVLKLIENSGQVKFRVTGKKVFIYK